VKPKLSEVAVTDFGKTIRLGKCEASAAAILYEFEKRYRRRAKHRQQAGDRSLGGTVRAGPAVARLPDVCRNL
jgi:hypothetical protein